MQNIYSENYKILLTELKEDLNTWENIPCSWHEVWTPVRWQCSPNEARDSTQSLSDSRWLLGWNWQIDAKVYMELQKTQNSQNNLETEQNRRIHTSLLHNLPPSSSHQGREAQERARGSVEQNWEPRNKTMHGCRLTDFQGCQDLSEEKEQSFWQTVLGRGNHRQKSKVVPLPRTIRKKKLKKTQNGSKSYM